MRRLLALAAAGAMIGLATAGSAAAQAVVAAPLYVDVRPRVVYQPVVVVPAPYALAPIYVPPRPAYGLSGFGYFYQGPREVKSLAPYVGVPPYGRTVRVRY
jgi:hypothetical protein